MSSFPYSPVILVSGCFPTWWSSVYLTKLAPHKHSASQRDYDKLVTEWTSWEHEANIQAQLQQIWYIHRPNKQVLSDPHSKNVDHMEKSTYSDTRTLSDDTAMQTTSSHHTPLQTHIPLPNTATTMANLTQIIPPNIPILLRWPRWWQS